MMCSPRGPGRLDEHEHVAPRDRAADAVHREVREEVRLLVRAARQVGDLLDGALERVVVGVGHVEREDVDARLGHAVHRLGCQASCSVAVGAAEAADRRRGPSRSRAATCRPGSARAPARAARGRAPASRTCGPRPDRGGARARDGSSGPARGARRGGSRR